MFSKFVTAVLFLLCSTAFGQVTISSASSTFAPVVTSSRTTSSKTIGLNFTSTTFNINATATSTPPVDACIIFVSANGTVPAFTITSQFPVPTSIFVNNTFNGTSTTSDSFNISTSTFSTEQFNSTLSPGPFPTNVSSFATTFYATVWTSGGLPSTSYAVSAPSGVSSTSYGLAVPSGLPICPNVTLSANGTSVNGTNSTSGQSLNSTQGNGNNNKPSSAISIKKISRDLAGAVMGAIGAVALAVV